MTRCFEQSVDRLVWPGITGKDVIWYPVYGRYHSDRWKTTNISLLLLRVSLFMRVKTYIDRSGFSNRYSKIDENDSS